MGTESLISINVLTMFFTLVNMILTYLILKKFLFKPVQKMIKDRQDEIDGLYQDAENAKTEAEEMKADLESRLQGAKETSAEMIRSAAATAGKRSEEIIRSAKNDAAALKEKAMQDIALEKKKALNEVKDDISVLALEIAEKVIRKEINAEDQKMFVDEFIDRIGEVQ